MSDLEKQERFNAYWFTLKATGVEAIDAILREIARAGKGSHSTEFWGGQMDHEGPNYVDQIQQAADAAARRFASLTSPETIEKAASVAFHTHWDENTVWTELFEDEEPEIQAHWRKVAEAVLRSVEEGTQ